MGELAIAVYGILNDVAELATFITVPSVIVGNGLVEIVNVLEVAEAHPPLVTIALKYVVADIAVVV